jgi:hypothetical protein
VKKAVAGAVKQSLICVVWPERQTRRLVKPLDHITLQEAAAA